MKRTILIGFLIVALLSGCTDAPPQTPDCENYCESLTPDIDCVGEWKASGIYPDCECEFECKTEPQPECNEEGESIPVIASPPECCEGLTLISPKDSQIVGILGYCTAKCGNGVCDEIESESNCPEDCGEGVGPYFCRTDSDCEVKDVHNCCGYFPRCVNKDYEPDINAVIRRCEEEGSGGICGFPDITHCECIDSYCQSMQNSTQV